MTMPESPKLFRVAIVGGGIGGLCLAVGILRQIQKGAAIDLRIYEQAPKFAEIGAGVAFGPNALKALDLLELEQIRTIFGCPPKEVEDLWFEFRFAETNHPDCGKLIHSMRGNNAGKGNVHRAQFLDALIELIPVKHCYFDHRLVDYTPNNGGGVSLTFMHKQREVEVSADLLLACDGIKSSTRKTLYKHLGIAATAPKEKYAEWVAWRGVISADTYKECMHRSGAYPNMWLGLDRHILTFPVKKGEAVNIVGFVRDPKHAKINGQTAPWTEERPKEEMLADFKGFTEECLALLGAIEKPSIWGIFDLPPLEVITGEGVVLVGDAAHATTPHQGSGAGQAIEDALFLSELLGHPSLSKAPTYENMRKAIGIYSKYRHDRAAKVQITSAECGLLYEGRGVHGEGQDVVKVRQNLEERMRWIWEYDTEAQLAAMLREVEQALVA